MLMKWMRDHVVECNVLGLVALLLGAFWTAYAVDPSLLGLEGPEDDLPMVVDIAENLGQGEPLVFIQVIGGVETDLYAEKKTGCLYTHMPTRKIMVQNLDENLHPICDHAYVH